MSSHKRRQIAVNPTSGYFKLYINKTICNNYDATAKKPHGIRQRAAVSVKRIETVPYIHLSRLRMKNA